MEGMCLCFLPRPLWCDSTLCSFTLQEYTDFHNLTYRYDLVKMLIYHLSGGQVSLSLSAYSQHAARMVC
jgi:hypothetical protein